VSTLDPIELQVITGALRAACEEMGATLVKSAHSANIKERRDASTALFDRDGEMVMQAEHIPVHLGSMPAAVRALLGKEHRAGVSWVLNDPYEGGTHLPDITVVTPVFACSQKAAPRARGGNADSQTHDTASSQPHDTARSQTHETGPHARMGQDESQAHNAVSHTHAGVVDLQSKNAAPRARGGNADSQTHNPSPAHDPAEQNPEHHPEGPLIGFAASRAHHADVGGRTPGSMPADSRTLEEEGVVIAPRALDAATIDELVAQMRNPAQRRADLRAQLAANRTGALRLVELAERVGVERLDQAMDAVLDYAERRTRACIAAMEDGVREAEDVLEAPEGDLVLRVKATVAGDRLVLDFEGSAAQHEGNLNCPLAVTLSACWFAVRVLTDPDIPPSAGAYRPVEVIVPEGSLLNARRGGDSAGTAASANPSDVARPRSLPTGASPAVAAGNVETSSRVADLVLGAFGRALGQGTMNNLTLGDDEFTYYETLGGGQGACADADGPSGVHVAMSNTLNTPIEALERELPVLVSEYALRRGSGGAGEHRGGDGVVRELEALSDMTFSLIGERRRHAPPGAHGGKPGKRGRDLLIAPGEPPRGLPAKTTGTLHAGERLRLETPGGGGYGRPTEE
jgi:N-methylhydantoinase B